MRLTEKESRDLTRITYRVVVMMEEEEEEEETGRKAHPSVTPTFLVTTFLLE